MEAKITSCYCPLARALFLSRCICNIVDKVFIIQGKIPNATFLFAIANAYSPLAITLILILIFV